jgi:hypothetical protein
MACVIKSKKKSLAYKPAKKPFSAAAEIKGELLDSFEKQRDELKQDNTKELNKKIKLIELQISECQGKRWLFRRKLDLETEKNNLLKEISDYLAGTKLKLFDEKMKPVLKRLNNAADNHRIDSSSKYRILLEDAERIVRKKLTKTSDPIILQHAITAEICDECGVIMRVIASDSLIGCPQCAKTRLIPIVSANNIMETDFVCNAVYNQKSRLLEWLEFCQAKEYAEPATEIIEMVMEQLILNKSTGLEDYQDIIAQERIENGPYLNVNTSLKRLESKIPKLKEKLLNIKAITVRAAMQNASSKNQDERLRKFYEKSPKYASYISGYWPLRFSSSQEDRIRKLYLAACPIYDKYRKPSQPNWPGGYAYFLRCLCVLLGWDEFCAHFNISAGPKNVQEREIIRKKIWGELGWELVPTSPPSSSYTLVEPQLKKRQRE